MEVSITTMEEDSKLKELELLITEAEEELEWLRYNKLLYNCLLCFFILATVVVNAALWILLR